MRKRRRHSLRGVALPDNLGLGIGIAVALGIGVYVWRKVHPPAVVSPAIAPPQVPGQPALSFESTPSEPKPGRVVLSWQYTKNKWGCWLDQKFNDGYSSSTLLSKEMADAKCFAL